MSCKNNKIRNKEVSSQIKEFVQMEKKKKIWTSDGWLKQYFLQSKEYLENMLSATRFQNMVKEMIMKVSLYNLFRRIA